MVQVIKESLQRRSEMPNLQGWIQVQRVLEEEAWALKFIFIEKRAIGWFISYIILKIEANEQTLWEKSLKKIKKNIKEINFILADISPFFYQYSISNCLTKSQILNFVSTFHAKMSAAGRA